MAVNDATGVINHNDRNIAEQISSTSGDVEGTVGGGGGGFNPVGFFSSMFGGGNVDFAGMDSDNLATFESAVDNYRDNIQSTIDVFNPDADMEEALKGDVATAVHEFLDSIKTLLKAYVAAIDAEKLEIREANENYLAAASSVAGDITGDSDSIRSAANGLVIE